MFINYRYARKRINQVFKFININKDMQSVMRENHISYISITSDDYYKMCVSVVTNPNEDHFIIYEYTIDIRLAIMEVPSEWIVMESDSRFNNHRLYIRLNYSPLSSVEAHDAIFKYHQN